MNKKDLRLEVKNVLSHISAQEKLNKSLLLSQSLNQFIKQNYSDFSDLGIGGFIPIEQEPIWYEHISSKYQISIVQMEPQMALSYFEVDLKKTDLKKLRFDLPEKETLKKCSPNIVLVPGLAFTENGQRLGRGKGYFDRFLEHFSGISIGICFEEQIVPNVYSEKHDQQLNFVITERNIFKGK